MPPAVTERQQRFMAICSHSPKHARGKCPSQKVAEEFSHKPAGGYPGKQSVKHRKQQRKDGFPARDNRGYY